MTPSFPNYLEARSGEEVDARIGVFIPLEYTFEQLIDGESPVTNKVEGARKEASLRDLTDMLQELAGQTAWEFHSYADETSGFVVEESGVYFSAHLIKKEDGTSLTSVIRKGDKHQEFPDWCLTVETGPKEIKMTVLKFDPWDGHIPEHDGSEFIFPPIPDEWDVSSEN